MIIEEIVKGDLKKKIKKQTKLNLKFISNSNVIIEVSNNAVLNLNTLFLSDTFSNLIDVNMEIVCQEGSQVNFDNIDNSLKNINCNIKVHLFKNSNCNIQNVVIGKASEHFYNIEVVNKEEKSTGYIEQKAVAKAEGIVKLNAVSKIEKFAIHSKNFQESTVLLLDDALHGEASPYLYIDTEEVLAGHKAKVSRVDEESIYYLQSRGISKIDAENMLLKSFVQATLDKMQLDENVIKKIYEELDD